MVVLLTPLLGQHLGFHHAAKLLGVQKLVAHLAVERLGVTILLTCQLHPIVTVSIEPSELLTPFILGSEGSSLWSPTGIIGTRTLFISIPTSNN
jgi:hypothetical protein